MSVFWSKVVLGTRTQNIFRSEIYECFYSENSYMFRLRQDCRTDFKWAHLSGSYSTFTLLLRLGSHLIRLVTRPQSQSLLMLSGFSRWYCMKFTQVYSRYTNSETISPLSLSISSSYSCYDMVWYIEYTPYTSPCLHPFVWNPVIEFNLSSKNRMKNSKNLEYIPPWQWDGPSNMPHMQEGEGAKIGVGQSDESASHPFFGMVMMIGMMMIIMKNHDHDNGLIVW